MSVATGKSSKAYMKLFADETAWGDVTWSESDVHKNLENVDINRAKSSEEIETRQPSKLYVTGSADSIVTFSLVYDKTDPLVAMLDDAYENDKEILGFFANGDAATPGTRGLRGIFTVTNFSESQPVGAIKFNVELKGTPNTNLTTGKYTVPGA